MSEPIDSGLEEGAEQRAHASLHLRHEVRAAGPRCEAHGLLVDLSMVGGRVVFDKVVALHGESIELYLPVSGEKAEPFWAEVLRVEQSDDKRTLAVRFAPQDDGGTALRRVFEHLFASHGGGDRQSPRLACRLNVRYQSLNDLRAILEDVSRGGFAMTTRQSIDVGEEVLLVIPDSVEEDLLTVRARVLHTRASHHVVPPVIRAGLAFTEMTRERRCLLDALLRFLVENELSNPAPD